MLDPRSVQTAVTLSEYPEHGVDHAVAEMILV